MKLHVQELEGGDKALNDNTNYYTDLRADDYIKQGGVSKTISYAVKDLTRPDNETNGKTYYRQIVVKLPEDFGTKSCAVIMPTQTARISRARMTLYAMCVPVSALRVRAVRTCC